MACQDGGASDNQPPMLVQVEQALLDEHHHERPAKFLLSYPFGSVSSA
jgi:hypothetical protein